MTKKIAHYQQAWEAFTGNSANIPGEVCRVVYMTCFVKNFHDTEPAFSFGDFCLTKKADSMLLLRIGARTVSRLGFSNDLKAVKFLEPSNDSCKTKLLCKLSLLWQVSGMGGHAQTLCYNSISILIWCTNWMTHNLTKLASKLQPFWRKQKT